MLLRADATAAHAQAEQIAQDFKAGKLSVFWKHLFLAIFYAHDHHPYALEVFQKEFPAVTRAVKLFLSTGKHRAPES